jgi:D-alanine-D-alanine ligase
LNGERHGVKVGIVSSLPQQLETAITEWAASLYKNMKMKGFVRLDFIVTNEKAYVLEANTIPGLAEGSNLTNTLKHCGACYDDIVAFSIYCGNEMVMA